MSQRPLRPRRSVLYMPATNANALVVAGDVLVVIDADGAKARRVAKEELRGLVWAAPLRVDPDRDDLVAVTEQRDGDEVVLTLHTFRLEGAAGTSAELEGDLVRLAQRRFLQRFA